MCVQAYTRVTRVLLCICVYAKACMIAQTRASLRTQPARCVDHWHPLAALAGKGMIASMHGSTALPSPFRLATTSTTTVTLQVDSFRGFVLWESYTCMLLWASSSPPRTAALCLGCCQALRVCEIWLLMSPPPLARGASPQPSHEVSHEEVEGKGEMVMVSLWCLVFSRRLKY